MGVKLVLSDGVAEIETGDGGRAAAVAHRVRPAPARGPGRARARRAPERRARPRRRHPARALGRHRGRPPDAHPGRGGVGGGRLRRVGPPALGPARRRGAGHAREQAGPGRGHQPRRRLRHVPRRDRHGHHQDLRPRGGAHGPLGAGGRGGRLPVRQRRGRLDDAGRLLPRRRPDPAQAPGRAAHGPAAGRPDRGPARTPRSGSTCWPRRSGTRWTWTRSSRSTSPTPRRSPRCGTRC